MRSGRTFFAITATAVTALALAQLSVPNGAPVADITERQLRSYLGFVAHDLMEGRDTPSRGLDITALFLSSLCQRWGLVPGGENGTFYQTILLDNRSTNPADTSLTIGETTFSFGDQMIAEPTAAEGSGEMVFVGNGIKVANGVDPYAGLNLRGKVIVALSGAGPRGLQGRAGADYWTPTEMAREHGAAAIIYLDRNAGSAIWQRRAQSYTSGRYTMPDMSGAPRIPTFYVGADAAQAILGSDAATVMSAEPTSEAMKSRALGSATVKFKVAAQNRSVETHNVIAILPGSDPTLKNEYVIVGAHYDHVGMRVMPDGSDGLYNGADDDGSGTVAILAMAEAAARARQKPKRSLVFIWHTGEEKGLWGSNYFVNHPTIPLDKVKAMINIDMIGRTKEGSPPSERNADLVSRGSIYMIGPRVFSPALDTLLRRVNNETFRLNLDPRYDDRNDPNRFWSRSDHVHYANAGIPIAFFFSGVHEDYHQPGDEIEKIDFGQLEKVSRYILTSLWEIATRDTLD